MWYLIQHNSVLSHTNMKAIRHLITQWTQASFMHLFFNFHTEAATLNFPPFMMPSFHNFLALLIQRIQFTYHTFTFLNSHPCQSVTQTSPTSFPSWVSMAAKFLLKLRKHGSSFNLQYFILSYASFSSQFQGHISNLSCLKLNATQWLQCYRITACFSSSLWDSKN